MKRKRTIGQFLVGNSITAIVLTVIIYIITILVGNWIFENLLVVNLDWKGMEAEDTYTYPFENINSKSIEALGGWIEIADEAGKVIFVKGSKQDDTYDYDVYQLLDYSVTLHKDSKQYPYIYNVYPVEGPEKEQYLYIVKFPKELYHVSIIANLASLMKHPNSMQLIILISLMGIFLLLFLTIMYFYHRFRVRHINKPLKLMLCGIQEMEAQNYKYRLDFNAEKEFACIRDSFNELAKRLEESEEDKRRIEKSKMRMLTEISHDLKTPITSIYGFSKLLYESKLLSSEERMRYIGYIYKKTDYIAQLIDELFEIAKLDDKGFEFSYNKVDMAEWLRQLVSEFYPEFENKDMNPDIVIDEESVFIEIDEKQMKRAVCNLLNNAVIYNPNGVSVQILFKRERNKIVLQIADNGIGISNAMKSRIFEPFTRVNENKAGQGTGLGLAITKKIIERHRGRIILTSNQEYKTIFNIQLPVYDEKNI